MALRTKAYRARKHKANITIHMDLPKRRYLLLKNLYSKAKGCASVKLACTEIICSLCLRLENGDWKFFNSFEDLEEIY